MKKIFLFIFLLPALLKAQVPGYEGKRFILSYNLDVLSNLSYIYGHTEVALPVQILFNNHLNAEYVLGRRFSLALDGAYSRNKVFITEGNATVNTGTYGLNVIFYPNNHNTLAPVGNYFKIRLFTGNATATGNIINNSSDYYGNPITVVTPEQTNLNINGFGIGFGNNMIINNHIVLTASVDMDYNILGLNANKVPQGASYQELTYNIQDHVLASYLFYFKLGIGGLLF
jgi:hypothetical protein